MRMLFQWRHASSLGRFIEDFVDKYKVGLILPKTVHEKNGMKLQPVRGESVDKHNVFAHISLKMQRDHLNECLHYYAFFKGENGFIYY